MKSILVRFLVVALVFFAGSEAFAQNVTLFPNQVPNGIASGVPERFHQRFTITLSGSPVAKSRMFTITAPSELVPVVGSVTATSNHSSAVAFFAGAPTAQTLAFGVTGGSLSGKIVTVEFDITTPSSFTGGSGNANYNFDFTAGSGLSDENETVAKKNNARLETIAFSMPSSVTSASGLFYKMAFTSLPDPINTGLSGLSRSPYIADSGTDVLYSFYLSADANLVSRQAGQSPVGFYSLMSDGAGGGPLIGTRQDPRIIPSTFIRENFSTVFSSHARDAVNGMISLAGTAHGSTQYIYVLADVAPGRTGYNASAVGALSGGVFLGRSGPLNVTHAPEFVVAGWDYDDDGNDNYDTTGMIQVPSDVKNMKSVDANRKDNRNITIDSGLFFNKGDAVSSLNSGLIPDPVSSVKFLYLAQDSDNPANFSMNIFLSTTTGRTASNFVGGGSTGIDSLDGAYRLIPTTTLTTSTKSYTYSAEDAVRGYPYTPQGTYYVYFGGTDGTTRVLSQVMNDPFIDSPIPATLTIKHSPSLNIDTFSLNDFDGSGDGDLDVITGIDVSPLISSTSGKFTSPVGPAQQFVAISWGGQGLDGDMDLDDNATIDFYYSTRSDFKDSRGSVSYTSGNSDGTDLLHTITQGKTDTHKIGQATENPDTQFDNQFNWDLWSYISAENTVPQTDARYYLYAMLTGGSTRRLLSLTRSGTLNSSGTSMAVNFKHPPYIRAIEPAQDISVTVDEPVLVSWEAVDVDNAESGGLSAQPLNASGKAAPNSRTTSPNIRILLTSADFGETTTWASITRNTNIHRLWVGNSGDGSLVEEVELNEGVDTSFVVLGNRMRNNLFNKALIGGSSGNLELQTGGAVGKAYYVYLAIDDGRDGSVADAVTGSPQSTDFGSYSPIVRAPGRVVFKGSVPTNPPTGNRFIVPNQIKTAVGELVKYPVVPDILTPGTTVTAVHLYLTVNKDEFEAIDQNPSVPGIQPFALGKNAQINSAKVNQGAYEQGSDLRMDFIYTDLSGGLTFFDGIQPLAIANIKAKQGSSINRTISLDNSGARETKMRDNQSVKIAATLPPVTAVMVSARATITVDVPLQGRSTTSSDIMTFFLRHPGSFSPITDALFSGNDLNAGLVGIQKMPSNAAADEYILNNVPSGRYVLTASIDRHLTGQCTVYVKPGTNPPKASPTLDGSGIERTALLAGDSAGYSTSATITVPDNFIDASDVNAINDALFSQPGESNYNTFADINRDNIVNATDFDFANTNQTSNTGQAGKIRPVFPTFKTALPEGSNEDALITLSNLPDGEVRAGETFDVTVNVSGARAVRTYEVHLTYDPSKLVAEYAVSSGDLLGDYLTNLGGKILKGEFGLVNSIVGKTPLGASGEGTLATVRFRAISRATETRLALGEVILIDVEHIPVNPKVDGEALITLSKDPIVYHDAEGGEIKGLILAGDDAKVDFNDFVALVKTFGKNANSEGYNLMADLNGDDKVDFKDFVIFSADFGKVAVDAPAVYMAAKRAPGANGDAQVSLRLNGVARMGELITLKADMSGVSDLKGWGLTLKYDPQQYTFVEAKSPQTNLLTADGATAPVFLVHQDQEGTITLANAISQGSGVTGEGSLAVLTFRPKGEFENALFEVADGLVFDADDLTNALFANDLEVKLAPASFALNQNYPNPFNPETTIGYDLADGSQVRLDIYNVTGQLINTLVSDHQPAGRYRMVWSGVDAGNRQVASGVYFYRLQTEQFRAVKKLMLLK